ncbi:hypothetical protein QBC39DRAFT_244295, partial [Podospora conica]
MAEVLAALGTAAAVAQFIDIALRGITKTKEVVQSADGLTKTNAELRLIAADIEEQSALLLSDSALVKPGSSLGNIIEQSTHVAAELTKELEWLQIDPASPRKRDKLRALWRGAVDKDAIPQLERRLSSLRAQICTHIVVSIQIHQRSLINTVTSLEESTKEWNLATTKKLNTISTMARDIQKAIDGGVTPTSMFASLATELKAYAAFASAESRVEAILTGLRFEHIRERESTVESAHRATFRWVYDKSSPVNLGAWLRTGNGTYWIEGKAGSGKSTLMKYLMQHEETSRSLQQWAGDKELFIGSHFFWIMGTSLQKSQIGLLRTMLFQILKRHPDLVPVACPDRFSTKDYEHLESWTMETLVQAFNLLISCKKLPVRMCFFIDGLDEYSGIHTDLIALLDGFSKTDSIKICVSSRPWPEFREAYGAITHRLCIHEFTRPDIHAFAYGRLTDSPRFEALRRASSGDEADRLVDEITTRAEGVFLWVYYVVRSLLRGLSNRDDVSVLRKRVKEFPRELVDFFKQMFNTIDSVYMRQAAALLKMLASHDQPLPVLPLALLDWEARGVTNTKLDPVEPANRLTLPFGNSWHKREREAITGRCRDLIHAVDFGNDASRDGLWDIRIGFLHRTVADFISTSDMTLVLSSSLPPFFSPVLHLLHAHALAVK